MEPTHHTYEPCNDEHHVGRISGRTSASQRFRMNSGFISRLSIRKKEGYHHSNYNNSGNNSSSNNNSVINLNNSNNDSENNTSNKLDLTSSTASSKLTTSPFRTSRKVQPRLQQQKQQQPQQQHSLIRKTYSSTADSSSGRHPPISRSTKLKRLFNFFLNGENLIKPPLTCI
ncbi:hypothetical protein HELRODRAFT_161071 [Helobdella robusta]|uniref:Uncharacterized protein n=1 Tax=Helobdella robusta TaxID=6412 RepID=T1ER27_HELRO|nr:hypothetical protein HELRODRAFT_161071 [Helobdella robusta]ESO01882.1 hypothetical protein HELRODRAFT_161071 [Helobdella robusta]